MVHGKSRCTLNRGPVNRGLTVLAYIIINYMIHIRHTAVCTPPPPMSNPLLFSDEEDMPDFSLEDLPCSPIIGPRNGKRSSDSPFDGQPKHGRLA